MNASRTLRGISKWIAAGSCFLFLALLIGSIWVVGSFAWRGGAIVLVSGQLRLFHGSIPGLGTGYQRSWGGLDFRLPQLHTASSGAFLPAGMWIMDMPLWPLLLIAAAATAALWYWDAKSPEQNMRPLVRWWIIMAAVPLVTFVTVFLTALFTFVSSIAVITPGDLRNESLIPSIAFATIAAYAAARFLATRIAGARPSIVPQGRCAVCRYDLTGNVSGVCPECGQALEARGVQSQAEVLIG